MMALRSSLGIEDSQPKNTIKSQSKCFQEKMIHVIPVDIELLNASSDAQIASSASEIEAHACAEVHVRPSKVFESPPSVKSTTLLASDEGEDNLLRPETNSMLSALRGVRSHMKTPDKRGASLR